MANKNELIERVSKEMGVSLIQAKTAVNAVLQGIGDTVIENGRLQLVGFGTFEVRDRAERKGKNPQTGKEMTIPATKVFAFKAGKTLKDKLNA